MPQPFSGEMVTFPNDSTDVSGYVARPQAAGSYPAVILFQEYWGVNAHVRSLVDRLAAEGFVVLAPDLYEGVVAKDATEAASLMQKLDWGKAMDQAKGAAKFLAAHPRSTGKLGVIGFCMGGALAFAAATEMPELAAAVPFYGIPDPKNTDYSKVRAPILAHFSKTDQWAKPELAADVKKQIDAQGGSMTLEVYDAGHAFMNDTRPEVHSPENAKLAWSRSVAFLQEKLS
jgi:carboxymethylenebutenolidase